MKYQPTLDKRRDMLGKGFALERTRREFEDAYVDYLQTLSLRRHSGRITDTTRMSTSSRLVCEV